MADNKAQIKWYFRASALITAFLCVGPLALPLVWFNPRLSAIKKIIITLIVIILSYYLWIVFKSLVKNYRDSYDRVFQQGSF